MNKVKKNNTFAHSDPSPKKQEKKTDLLYEKKKPEITNIPEEIKKIKISEENPLISYPKKRDTPQANRIEKNSENTDREIISNKKENEIILFPSAF